MTSILSNPRERIRFMRFAMVGVIGAVVDFGVENILHRLFGVNYVLAGGISFISAIMSNFVWNRYWTYPDSRSKPIVRQLGQFFLINLAGLVIRIPILHLLEPIVTNWMHQLPDNLLIMAPDMMGENLTLAFAVLVVMFWNFFVNRYITYSDVT